METNNFERWLPAAFNPGFEVSDFGNVRFVDSKELCELRKGADGFIYANLDLPVHYLVAGTWQPHLTGEKLVEGKFKVKHIDGDTTNNQYDNLFAYMPQLTLF
ncbi:hypothetical protein MUN82_01820 [Hymenobacter aerilatus]|uniref:HNH nuclease domain-containing protein n=1 Tax=Hymenobacter aerilatus TaxID=2932251 RepID=A0A8T9SUS7_9BACT|nr:hypothetical protein [Hymenobacter aerilatus]UOR05848.1 hypothetical protein MUN82_01820 [Hymenobacter aerilatus]